MVEDVETESHNLGIVEREAAEILKVHSHLCIGFMFKLLMRLARKKVPVKRINSSELSCAEQKISNT